MLPAVVYIVGIGKTPAPIEEEEIASLRVAAHSGLPMIPIEYLPGERVRIEAGPLAGVTGIVAGRRNDRIVVSITLLQRSIAVNLPPEWLSSLRSVA
jgi:transcription antitermination factor NusG